MHIAPKFAKFATLLLLAASVALADNWPQFRGSNAMGVAEAALPEAWDNTKNVAWKAPVPGMGWSSPVVWADHIFLTTAISAGKVERVKEGLYFGGDRPPTTDSHEWRVLCFSLATGSLRWSHTVHRGVPPLGRHLKNSFASETPITDGERVYAYIGNVGLFTFDMDGDLLWTRKWPPVKTRYGWGTAASPYLHDGRLYLINDNDEQSFLEAIDIRDGKTLWRVDRDEPSNWSPPFVWTHAGRSEIITTGSKKVRAYDLDGAELWTLTGLSSITVTSPFAADGLLYFGSGYVGDKRRPFFAVKPGASGDISLRGKTSSAHIAWSQPQGAPYMPTPVLYDGRLYVLMDRGILVCSDAKTGERIYRQRLESSHFTASPLVAAGKIYCFGEHGETHVIAAGDRYQHLHTNELGELIMATPAIARNSLIVRGGKHLFCIRQ